MYTFRRAIVAITLVAVAATGCSSSGAGEANKAGGSGTPIVLEVGTDDFPPRPAAEQIEEFGRRVAELSDDFIRVEPVWEAGDGEPDWDQVVARKVMPPLLERVARLCGAHLISVDLDDCENISSYEKWTFVRRDDIRFAGEFGPWCRRRHMVPEIDVLFIDTSHLFEHTLREIECWFPFLSGRAKFFFHDTNMKEIFRREDGSLGHGWNSDRGVIRAIEAYLGKSFDESKNFVDIRCGWLVKHHAHCNGFTILERMSV
jgi:hypothetical protein